MCKVENINLITIRRKKKGTFLPEVLSGRSLKSCSSRNALSSSKDEFSNKMGRGYIQHIHDETYKYTSIVG